ncbi:TRAP transporter substrate-binding protein DctP [Nocardioides insulae]|uniref:TRAP transporter substrate-binding protein DctP n=1 Tax=Nocardioides insulae TaxID=394734 RepID=UPI000A020FD8|nr:TRAP transporter substrate-binding protein DctP [Nocardioides insulae]
MDRHIRQRVLAGGTVGVLIAAVLGGCGGPQAEQEAHGATVLRIGDSFPATHPIGVGGVTPFLEYLDEHGPEAGLEVEYFANGQVGDQSDMPALLRKRVVDMAPVSPAYVGTELPLSNVGDLPGLVPDACTGADAVLASMQEGTTLFEEELAPHGIRPLWVALVPDYELLGTNKPVLTPEQAAGRLLRSTGGVADRVVDEVGAAGVSMPLGELFEALSRGTVDGTVASPVSIASYKLGEVLDFATDGARLGSFTVTFSISETTWDTLTEEQREILLAASRTAQEGVCREMVESGETAVQEMRDQGVELIEIGAAERAQWDAIAEPVREGWAEDLESIGRPGRQVLTEFEQELEKAKRERGSAS